MRTFPRPITSITPALALMGLSAPVVAQTLPDAWSRLDDWVIAPDSAHGTSAGNPSVDSEGNAVWHFDYAVGGPLGSATPWYLEPFVPMTWDASWFSGEGAWSFANDVGCTVRPSGLNHYIWDHPSNHFDSIPIVRWKNVTSQSFAVRILGPVVIIWSGPGNTGHPVDIDFVLAHRDGATGQLTTLLANTYAKPTPNSIKESITLSIDVQDLQIGPGDEIFWTHRGSDSASIQRWMAVADRLCIIREPIGTNYCGSVVPNSTGVPSVIAAQGSLSAVDNNVSLKAVGLPPQTFGYFLTSRTQGFVMNPAGSLGHFCLSGSVGRYIGPGQVQQAGDSRAVSLALDLTQHPSPTVGLIQVMAGDTWSFQYWHRDSSLGNPTNNFSNGIELTFQ